MKMKKMTTLQPRSMKQKRTGIVQFGIVAMIAPACADKCKPDAVLDDEQRA
jgi:hypothetical protein